MKFFKIIFLFLMVWNFLQAQVLLWEKRFDGGCYLVDDPSDLYIDKEGFIYITGSTLDTATSYDMLLLKYDSDGNLIWSTTYNGPYNRSQYGKKIVVDMYKNIYVVGQGCINNDNIYDFICWRYDPNGNLISTYAKYGGSYTEWLAKDIIIEKNIYPVVLYSDVESGSDEIFIISKIGTNLQFQSPSYDYVYPQRLLIDSTGFVYVAGYWTSARSGGFVTKLNLDFSEMWTTNVFFGNYNFFIHDAILDNQGNIYIVGSSDTTGIPRRIVVGKINEWGYIQWINKFRSPSNFVAEGYFIENYRDSFLYVVGLGRSGTINKELILLKYDLEGNLIWDTTYYPDSIIYINSIDVDERGNLYLVGQEYINYGLMYDGVILIFDPFGNLIFKDYYNGPSNYYDYGIDIQVDTAGNFYVLLISYGSGSNYDIVLLKYSQEQEYAKEKNATQFSLPVIYDLRNKKFILDSGSSASLKIFDVSGRIISSFSSVKGGGVISLSDFTNNGIYFYNLRANKKTFKGKILVVK